VKLNLLDVSQGLKVPVVNELSNVFFDELSVMPPDHDIEFVVGLVSNICITREGLRLAVIKCIYLPSTYLHFIQDIEDRCLLLTSSMSFVDLPFQEHRMTEKHHMDQNLCIS
jgi:hypothetical protein